MIAKSDVIGHYDSRDFKPGDDELHTGKRAATAIFSDMLPLLPGMRVLDIGSGLGGPARYIAHHHDVHVTGIDLTPSLCEKAAAISEREGLAYRTEFHAGDALSLPFPDAAFDAAYSIHAAMNIAARQPLYAEAARALKPGAFFGLYDVMAVDRTVAISYPLPWASVPEQSFLYTREETEAALEKAGFHLYRHEDLHGFALSVLEKANRHEAGGTPFPSPFFLNFEKALRDGACTAAILLTRKL